MRRTAGLLLAGVLALTACSSGSDDDAASPAPAASASTTPTPLPVGSPVVWLCRPTAGGVDDAACREGLDAAVVAPEGRSTDPFEPAADPPVDCFYVYPTVSRAPGLNAPEEPEPAVVATVRAQAALFGEVCRLFVPVYRQVTVEAIATGRYGDVLAQSRAQADVVDAWHEYLNEDNDGRGVVLVGHSQGAMQLARLLQERVAERPSQRDLVVSALLVGGGASTAEGSDVADQAGGLPACREPGQTGCVVAYSTFSETPPQGALFGRAAPGRQALCTDPTRLSGGDGALHPYVPTDRLGPEGGLARAVPAPDPAAGFVALRGAGTARCVQEDGASWLQVDAVPGSALDGPLTSAGALGPAWGLHTADVTLALGDLVDVVRLQAEAWQDD